MALIFYTIILHLISIFPPSAAQFHHISSFSISDLPWLPSLNQTLLSPNSTFAAGFLPQPTTPSSSSVTYYAFSVWYFNITTTNTTNTSLVVWSTNANFLVIQSTPLLITPSGQLRLNNKGENLFPSMPTTQSNSTQLILTDQGNLVFGIWNSFAHPTNTILPNQPINNNGTTLSTKDGKYKFVHANQLFFFYDDDNVSYYNSGKAFQSLDYSGRVSQEDGGSFISSDFGESSKLRRLTLDDDGNLRIYSFDSISGEWIVVWRALFELCRISGRCGPNSICMPMYDGYNSTFCQCPPGFRPAAGGSDQGCERKIPMMTTTGGVGHSKFLRLDYVNFSGGSNHSFETSVVAGNYSTCEGMCFGNLNCEGFRFKYNGKGYCVHLTRLTFGYWSPGTEAAFFLRVGVSERDESNFLGLTNVIVTTCPVQVSLPEPPNESESTTRNIAIISTLFAAELICGAAFFWAFLKKYVKYRDMAQTFGLEFLPAGGPRRFSYAELKDATNNFSNGVGRGGFGDVYRGELSDHRIVAVKCLKNVVGGDAEFWAEVTIIARMHHLNLVRLWGFCAEKGQRILVYEYVPNGSLDKFLFEMSCVRNSEAQDQEMDVVGMLRVKPVLDWNIRYRIALGVASALAYLHEECLEWVLHCDIKPENILLGDDFCPKISDFGLSKLRKKEDMVSYSKARGTRGYMAPEWVKSDQITPKADVYSFGMVLLEIVTGVRNFEIQGSKTESEDWYFPRWAFEKVYKEMNVEDILDSRMKHLYDSQAHFDMINRMVKTSMWCLQDQPETRPSMGKVAKMLRGTVEIMEPKKPTIFFLADEEQ